MNKKKTTKSVVTSESVMRKDYSYELNGTTLKFNLRQDKPVEMIAFRILMEKALIDITHDLEKLNAHE